MTTAAIIQSSYLPWRGYFDIVAQSDVFVFLEDVQFTRRDWRTRNKIYRPDGTLSWMTVPVRGGRDQLIKDVRIDESVGWRRKHLEALRHAYARSAHFGSYYDKLSSLLEGHRGSLSQLNRSLTEAIAGWLGIYCEFRLSTDFESTSRKDDRLIEIVRAVGADRYLSGPSARNYIDERKFEEAGIELVYQSYEGYPDYEQFGNPFVSQVSVVDALFHCGSSAPDYVWRWRKTGA